MEIQVGGMLVNPHFPPIDTVSLMAEPTQLLEPTPSPLPYLLIDFILVEILPKLPAKSLLRFKSVCKSFNTVISSPEFIRLHLRQSLSSDNRLLIINGNDRTLYSFDIDSLPICSTTFRWTEGSIAVIGSCNGLLLVSFFGTGPPFFVINPSTRAYINIPSNALPLDRNNIGFGFDDHSDEYKLVMVSNNRVANTRDTVVYGVKSKSWKVVDQIALSDSMEEHYSGVLINSNLLHWWFWSPSKRKRRIGCFDVCTEKWMDDVLLPSYYYDDSYKKYLLDFGVLDGRLSSSFENRDKSCYDVWVMKKYGVQESWIKLLSIAFSDNMEGGVVLVASRGAGSSEVLLRRRHTSNLFWYNEENNVINTARAVPKFKDFQPYICKGSLVSLPDELLFGSVYTPDEPDREQIM